MKSICLSLAAAATIVLAVAAPTSSALAGTHPGARAPTPAVVAPPRIVVPKRNTQLPPQSVGGKIAQPESTQPLVRHCTTPDGCYWLAILCKRDGGGMNTNPDGTASCTS